MAGGRAALQCGTDWQAGGLTIGVSTHGDTINSILHYVLGTDERFLSNCEPANCSVTRLAFDSGGWAVLSVNDAGISPAASEVSSYAS